LKTWFKRIFGEAFSLTTDLASHEEIYDRFVNGAALKGTNMCILILAILIASIGLNMNATAVIIGAMLISPLMSSILAIAYGLATGDLKTARHYLAGFAVQILISLLTSTVYFSITPISSSTSELLARTTPTIWDVLIAICGGLAGSIGLTRKEKSNVIPGVAIATALMPPLCTAGYGLATGQMEFFFGAIYLFILNTYFICFSSMIVLLILKVPQQAVLTEKAKKKAIRNIAISAVILILPSLFFGARMIEDSNITGFEDPNSVKMQELGDETTILFPQVERISIGAVYEYEDGEVVYADKMIVNLNAPLSETQESRLRTWLMKRSPQIETIEFVQGT